MKLGLVGFPQVGKKTLFKLLTGNLPGQVGAKNGSLGLARVRDARFSRLADLYQPARKTPAVMEFSLLPDLDQEASRNAEALNALEEVDVICHLVRAFADDTVFHIAGQVDPARDIRSFATELQLSDLIFIEKRLERLTRELRVNKEDRALEELDLLTRMQNYLEEERPLRCFSFSTDESKLIASYPLLTRKAVINVLNVGENQLGDESLSAALREEFAPLQSEWITVSAKIEEELSQLDEEDRQVFLEDLDLDRPALDRLTQLCYHTLGLISFFTVGEDEVRAWTIRRDSLAPKAGRAIHSDIERGFIRTEVMKYDDLIELGSEPGVKEAGKLRQKGRNYVVEDGDIMHFLFKV